MFLKRVLGWQNSKLIGKQKVFIFCIIFLIIMVKTIGTLHKEAKELERKGHLGIYLEQLIEAQERKLKMKHLGRPRIIIDMCGHGIHRNGRIYIKYLDEELIYHELGHFYLFKLHSRIGLAYPEVDENKKITEWWGARNSLLSEGIATYFEKGINGRADDFNDSEYPEAIEDFLTNRLDFLLRLYYSGGYHLVKPILDGFGIEEGCKRLLLNPPKKEELTKLPEYRKRVLSGPVNCN